MSDKGKSVLDGVKVENKAFPQDPDYTGPGGTGLICDQGSPTKKFVVVGACPHCGGPIYGEKEKDNFEEMSGQYLTGVKYSCTCRHLVQKNLWERMQTK